MASSRLSREAWLSAAALVVMGLYGAGLVFYGVAIAPRLGWGDYRWRLSMRRL